MYIMCFLNTEAHPAGKTNLVIPPRRLKHPCGRRSRRLPSGSAVRCCDGGVTPATALGRPRRRGSSLNGTRCAHFRAKQPLQSEVPGAPRSAESEVTGVTSGPPGAPQPSRLGFLGAWAPAARCFYRVRLRVCPERVMHSIRSQPCPYLGDCPARSRAESIHFLFLDLGLQEDW